MARKKARPAIGERYIFHRKLYGMFVPDGLAKYKGVSLGAKLLWACLHKFSGKDGRCFPTEGTLAEKLGCSVRTVQRWMAELVRDSFVEVVKLPGYWNKNGYHLLNHTCFDSDWRDGSNAQGGELSTSDSDNSVVISKGNGDRTVAGKRDRTDGCNTTGPSCKENQKIEIKKENYHYSGGPKKADFGGCLGVLVERGRGGDYFEISGEDEEYIELVMEFSSSHVGNKACYRKALERLARKGELDKSDLEELRERKRRIERAAQAEANKSIDEAEKAKRIAVSRSAADRINRLLDEGELQEADLRLAVEEERSLQGVSPLSLELVLRRRKGGLGR